VTVSFLPGKISPLSPPQWVSQSVEAHSGNNVAAAYVDSPATATAAAALSFGEHR